ncbi:hypothetical protein F4825DRAFT_443353 [Nemania diffusa]|nr:hypothetical protein F4825DRAFT_443353 [Nemania diffusa]
MGAEDNPFVRFKNYIDNNARRGFDALFGSFAPPSPTSSPSPSQSPSPSSTTSPSTTTSSHRDSSSTSATPMTTNTPLSSQEQQQEQQPQTRQKPSSTPSWSSWSSIFKMPSRVSPTASSAAESDQHSTPPTTPTSTTTNSTTPTVTMDDVHTWSVQSTYSPLNLQHLPQPTPRVFPHVRAEGVFTFRDAFEDLLVAGSGQPLPSDRDLMRRKIPELLPSMARDRERGNSNGLHVAHWVSGIAALGLWDAYFRLEPPARTMADSGRFQPRRMYFGERGAGAAPFGTSFGSSAAWGRRGGDRDGVSAWRAFEDREVRARANFGARGAWDSAWRFGGGAQDRDWEEDENENQRESRDADVEDELYRPSRPTKDVWRVADSGADDSSGGLRKPAVPPEVTTTVYADGSRSVTTTERRREENGGKTRVTTTAQHFDAAGNLVSESRESSSTRTWSGKIPGAEASFSWSWNSDSRNEASGEDREGRDRDREDDGEERKDEKSGWFWKR